MLICCEGITLLKADNFQVFTLENGLIHYIFFGGGGHQLHFSNEIPNDV